MQVALLTFIVCIKETTNYLIEAIDFDNTIDKEATHTHTQIRVCTRTGISC